MKRSQLRDVIRSACTDALIAEADTARLVATADAADRVAIGHFQFEEDGFSCGCPAHLAGYWDPSANRDGSWKPGTPHPVMNFPSHFDKFFRHYSGAFDRRLPVEITPGGNEYVVIEDD